MEGEPYHKTCFKCARGGCLLTTASYASHNGILYCQIHFWQVFKETGSYSNLLQPAAGMNAAADEPEAAAEPAKAEPPEEEASPEQVPEAPEVQEAEAPTRDARGRIYALHVCWNFSLFVLACFLAPILYPCQTAICLFGQ